MNSDRLATAILMVWGATMSLGLFFIAGPPNLPDLSVHIYWYLGRSSGFVAYWLLFASVALGLAVASRVFDGLLGRGWVFEVHKFLSIFVLVIMVFHVLILLPDPYAKFKLREFLIPFESHYRGTAVALGTLTLYGSVLTTVSFYLKGLIGQNGWRVLHYTTFVLWLGALAHGTWAGTDAGRPAVQISYLASGIAVLFLTFFRILATRAAGGKPRPAKPPAASHTGQAAPAGSR